MLLAVTDNSGLAALDLFEVSDYAVMARYDLQFWPDEETATKAMALALEVKQLVLTALVAGADGVEESSA